VTDAKRAGSQPAGPRAPAGDVRASPTPVRVGRSRVEDISAVLWPPPLSLSLAPRGRAAGAGEQEFILLPTAGDPRLIVPAGRRASAAAVRRYGEPGSFKTWAGKRMLALALLGGGAAVGLGGRLRVRTTPDADTVEAYLSAVLGRDVLVSTHLGAARANRKLVLQILTARGETVGFAKISVNPLTKDLIRAERAALDVLAAADLRGLTSPRVLHHGQWRGREVLVMNALPAWRQRRTLRPGQLAAAMSELSAVGGHVRGPLAGSDYLARLRSRLGTCPDGPDRESLTAALAKLAASGAQLTFGAWHGDWTNWNMACTSQGLLVWDWERFGQDVPVGFDFLHYQLQTAVMSRHQSAAPAAAVDCVRNAPRTLAQAGTPSGEAPLITLLYLAELSTRYLAERQAEAGARLGDPGFWLIPAIEKAVRSL
jgi:hypothetical protein